MKNLSFQLYSARNFPPLAETFKLVARLGYTEVETYGAQYDDPEKIRAAAEEAGLRIPTGHFGLDMLLDELPRVIRTAKLLGITTVICPYLVAEKRPSNKAGWEDIARQLERISKELADQGLALAWHNHDFEMIALADGSVPIDTLLDTSQSLLWEADIAWIVRAGVDPLASIKRHQARITAVHVKDIAPEGECVDEDGWADVGHGTMDWPGLLKALAASPVKHFVMEHDNPSDTERFARRSIEAVKAF